MSLIQVVTATSTRQSLEEAFPETDPCAKPFGTGVLLQLRTPKQFTQSGIEIPEEAQEFERSMTTIGKIISLGPLAYKNRDDPSMPWPEGEWCKPGDFVRCPKWGGDRWEVPIGKDHKDVRGYSKPLMARFVIFRDRELLASIHGDPLAFVDYI